MVECVFTKYAEEAGGFDAFGLNKSKKKKMWHCGKVRKCEK